MSLAKATKDEFEKWLELKHPDISLACWAPCEHCGGTAIYVVVSRGQEFQYMHWADPSDFNDPRGDDWNNGAGRMLQELESADGDNSRKQLIRKFKEKYL